MKIQKNWLSKPQRCQLPPCSNNGWTIAEIVITMSKWKNPTQVLFTQRFSVVSLFLSLINHLWMLRLCIVSPTYLNLFFAAILQNKQRNIIFQKISRLPPEHHIPACSVNIAHFVVVFVCFLFVFCCCHLSTDKEVAFQSEGGYFAGGYSAQRKNSVASTAQEESTSTVQA